MKYVITILILVLFASCQQKSAERIVERKIVDFNTYQTYVTNSSDTLILVNFWATWCKPCVEELPYFIKATQAFKNKKFKMLFVSLDRASDFESKVIPFIQEKNMQSDLFLLNDVKNMNTWIPAINKYWTGAIPVTILYKNGKQVYFHEGQLKETELINTIKSNL